MAILIYLLKKFLLYLFFTVCLQLFCWFGKNGISTSLNLSLDSSPAYHLKVFTQENKNLFENFLSEKNGKQAKNIMAAKYKLFLRFVWIKLKEGEMFVSFLPLLRQKRKGIVFSFLLLWNFNYKLLFWKWQKLSIFLFFFHLFNVPWNNETK